MGPIRRLLIKLGRDYVVLRCHDGHHLVRSVRWECDAPFAASYGPETKALLMPGGRLEGRSYLHGWLPASPRMKRYFAQPASDDVAAPTPPKA